MAGTSIHFRPFGLAALFVTLALVIGGQASSAAQQGPALSGIVVDEAGAALPGARVTIADGSGRIVHVSTTNGEGRFAVDCLDPGAYTAVIELALRGGHRADRRPAVRRGPADSRGAERGRVRGERRGDGTPRRDPRH